MNIKSLLLGSAAALVAVSGARAADAIEVVAEPEPMEYVRVCDTYGEGFFYIPGTETCLRVGGHIRYDIKVGDLLGLDLNGDGDDDTYDKRAQARLILDARSETELGTLRGFMVVNFNYDTNNGVAAIIDNPATPIDESALAIGATATDTLGIDHAYIELGGFRVGKTDSLFVTMTNYAGGVILDDLVGYGPFGTHQVAYTFNAGNGFTAAVALEEGSTGFIADDYVPHVVAGVAYTAGWGGISGVAGYDSNAEEFAGKLRADVTINEMFSAFVMGGFTTDDDDLGNGNFYANWGGDWAVWGGVTAKVSEKAAVNVQLSYDDFDNFAAVANVAYQVVPGLTVTPEVAYVDNFEDDTDDGSFGGFLRFQRNF